MKSNKGKRLSLLLTAAMLLGILPTTSLAAEPTTAQLVTKDQLTTFDTDDSNGDNSAKVYFGDNNQQWYIAGSQSADTVVLFATAPVGSNVKFESNWNSPKKDPALWADCSYLEEKEIKEVSSNHYGADSTLRNTLQNLKASHFTAAEQNLMLPTTIYTLDSYNNVVYSVTDTLYAPYGDEDNRLVTVGANAPDALNSGLVISGSCNPSRQYWLRTPDSSKSQRHNALSANSSGYVSSGSVKVARGVCPAFQLDLSSVLFASSIPAAESDGMLTASDALTLRYASSSIGSAEVSADKTQVTLTEVPAGTYLMVQNGEGTQAKSVDGVTSVSASDMGVSSFENCEVWLEQADAADNMVYAAMATEEVRYSVEITGNTGITITSGNGTQSVKAGAEIEAVTLQAGPEYFMPDDYQDTIQGLNGLTVTRAGDTITISGTPESDVVITLEALGYKAADYSKVDAAIEKANALNKDDYKDFSAVETAIEAVVRDKDITEQETVDGYAAAIEDAISKLEAKPTDPTKPEEPTKPTDPTKPEEPAKPTDPTKPEEPTKPADPTKPAEPAKPTDPTKPVTPAQPGKPSKPNTPHTGDNSNAMLWTSMGLLALAGLVFVFFFGKRKTKH